MVSAGVGCTTAMRERIKRDFYPALHLGRRSVKVVEKDAVAFRQQLLRRDWLAALVGEDVKNVHSVIRNRRESGCRRLRRTHLPIDY